MSGITKDEDDLRRENFRLAQEKELLLATLARVSVRLNDLLDVLDEHGRSYSQEFDDAAALDPELLEVFAYFDYDAARVARVGSLGRAALPVKP